MAATLVGGMIGGLAFEAGVTWFGTTLWASVTTGAVLGNAMFGERNSEDYLFDEKAMNSWSEGMAIPINYGETTTSGNVIYKRVSKDSTKLFLAVSFGEGEVEDISEVWADGRPIGDLEGYVRSEIKRGTENQEAVAWLFSSSEEQERWKHTAYIAFEFEASADIWSIPDITAIIKGRRIRERLGHNSWVTRFSKNPIWCLYDLLTNERYGVGVKSETFDEDSWQEAAEFCNQLVNGERRFELDICIKDRENTLDIIDTILATCRGHLFYTQGKLKVIIEKDEIPVQAFTPENIIPDSFAFQETSRKSVPNQIVIEWLDAKNEWSFTSTEWNDEIRQEDEGGINSQSVELKGIIRASQAGRMARFIYDSMNQCRKICTFGVGIGSLQSEVGDVIKVSHFTPGWHEKLFRIIQIEENEQEEMTITAREHNPLIYHDRGVDTQEKFTPPEPDHIAPPGKPQNLKAVTLNVGQQPRIGITWDRPEGGIAAYQLQFRQGSVSNWTDVYTSERSYTIAPLATGEKKYAVRVRAISIFQQSGNWTDTIITDTTPSGLFPHGGLTPNGDLFPTTT